MESSGEYIPPKQIKPADRQGQPTVKQVILERMREKLASSVSTSKQTAPVKEGISDQKAPQTAQEVKI